MNSMLTTFIEGCNIRFGYLRYSCLYPTFYYSVGERLSNSCMTFSETWGTSFSLLFWSCFFFCLLRSRSCDFKWKVSQQERAKIFLHSGHWNSLWPIAFAFSTSVSLFLITCKKRKSILFISIILSSRRQLYCEVIQNICLQYNSRNTKRRLNEMTVMTH